MVTDVKILLVDDEESMHEILTLYLTKEGFVTLSATDGPTAIKIVEDQQPDLIILDVNLPGMDGFEVCQVIRQITTVPIIFLSAQSGELDQIIGHRIGGDDYVTKPFLPGLLVTKVRAQLRRAKDFYKRNEVASTNEKQKSRIMFYENLTIEKENGVVRLDGKVVPLSSKEFRLLCLLAENPNRVFSVEQLFDSIWGQVSLGDYRTVMVHISNLRKKIEMDSTKPSYILTVRGMGYKFDAR